MTCQDDRTAQTLALTPDSSRFPGPRHRYCAALAVITGRNYLHLGSERCSRIAGQNTTQRLDTWQRRWLPSPRGSVLEPALAPVSMSKIAGSGTLHLLIVVVVTIFTILLV